MATLITAKAPTARPFDLLAGGEQHGGDLLVHGEQHGAELLAGEPHDYDLLAGGEYRARTDLMSAG